MPDWRGAATGVATGVALAAACALAGACAELGEPEPDLRFRAAERAEPGRFDPERSLKSLDLAIVAYGADRDQEAQTRFREAAELWPANVAAWQGLALLADEDGREDDRAAALFMVERLAHYPAEELFVQREINGALRTYVETQRAAEDGELQKAANAELLAAYLDDLYARHGSYDPPARPFFNVEGLDYVGVIMSGGGLGFFAYSLTVPTNSE